MIEQDGSVVGVLGGFSAILGYAKYQKILRATGDARLAHKLGFRYGMGIFLWAGGIFFTLMFLPMSIICPVLWPIFAIAVLSTICGVVMHINTNDYIRRLTSAGRMPPAIPGDNSIPAWDQPLPPSTDILGRWLDRQSRP